MLFEIHFNIPLIQSGLKFYYIDYANRYISNCFSFAVYVFYKCGTNCHCCFRTQVIQFTGYINVSDGGLRSMTYIPTTEASTMDKMVYTCGDQSIQSLFTFVSGKNNIAIKSVDFYSMV